MNFNKKEKCLLSMLKYLILSVLIIIGCTQLGLEQSNISHDKKTIIYDSELVNAPGTIYLEENGKTFSAAEDAYLQNGTRKNDSYLKVEPGVRVSYLKFNVSGVTGSVNSAKLRLYCDGDAGNGTIKVYKGNSNNWTENNLSTSNAPSKGAQLDSISGAQTTGNWYEWDVKGLVNGNSTYSFVMEMDNGGNDAWFASAESGNGPQVVINGGTSSSSSSSSSQSNKFNRDKDLLLAQFDLKPDEDDVHSVAAVACILSHEDYSDVNYFAVAGAYGKQGGTYIHTATPGLFDMAFGSANWKEAHGNWNNVVDLIQDKAEAVIKAGGKVWVAEAGQSDITRDWVHGLRTETDLSNNKIKNNVIVVQHSNANESMATTSDLNDVKNWTTYHKIDDGNQTNNSTPGYKDSSTSWLSNAKSSSNPNSKARELWIEADRICDNFDSSHHNAAIVDGGVDFSDTSETWWILELGNKGDTISSFWSNFVSNTTEIVGPAGYTYCCMENESYTFTDTVDVAYGANGQFAYESGVTGIITFNNARFGDPIPGVKKYGFYKKVTGYNDDIKSVTAPSSVKAGSTVQVTVEYSSSTNRDVIVRFQLDHNPWTSYGVEKKDVSAGSGTLTFNIAIPANTPVKNDEYQFQTYITTNGDDWGDKIDNIVKKDIDVTASSSSSSSSISSSSSSSSSSDNITVLTNNDKDKAYSVNGVREFQIPSGGSGVLQVKKPWQSNVQFSINGGAYKNAPQDWGGEFLVPANSNIKVKVKTPSKMDVQFNWW